MFIRKNPVLVFVLSLGFLAILSLLDWQYSLGAMSSFLLWIIALSLFVYSSYLLLDDFIFESEYFKYIFFIFIFYEIIIFARGMKNNEVSFFSFGEFFNFFHGYYLFWSLVIPLFIFFNKKMSTFNSLFDWSYKLGIIGLVVFLLFPFLLSTRGLAETVIPGFTYGCGILLMYSAFVKDKKVNISFIVLFIALLSFTYLARRNNIITILGFIFFSYILNIRSTYRPKLFKFYPLLLFLVISIGLTYSSLPTALTARLTERLTEDTRSEVFVPFFMEMEDYKLLGKGLDGTYYYPIGSNEPDDEGVTFAEVEYRNIIEIGYLQLFLSGGLIHVLLFLLILIPASINGVFRSKNLFAKASGVIIFLWLIDMAIYGLPILSFHYIFVWISVGICYKSSIRMKTDDEIRSEFQLSRLI